MTVFAVGLLVLPLLRARPDGGARTDHALEVYRRQLDEIREDVHRGLLAESEAAGAEIEIKRRMLQLADGGPDEPADNSSGGRRLVALIVSLLVPLLAGGFYLSVGSPGLEPNRAVAQVRGADEEHMDMGSLVQKLTARLAESPDDLSGWMLLGRSYSTMGDFDAAVSAYEKAVELLDGAKAPMVLAEYAEALVFRDEGTISPQASEVFRNVLEIAPGEPRSRFYLAVARAQGGDLAGALEDWVALARQAEPGAPWLGAVRRQIDQAAAALGVDVATLLPDTPPVSMPSPAVQPATGPSAEQIAEASAMPEGDRADMIAGMVARLATRLEEEEPENIDGWLRLARAYGVQGQETERLYALGRAAAAGTDRMDAQAAYAEALQDAGEADPVSDRFAETMRAILALEPGHKQALWFLGAHALQVENVPLAREFWEKLQERLTPGSLEYEALSRNIAALGGE